MKELIPKRCMEKQEKEADPFKGEKKKQKLKKEPKSGKKMNESRDNPNKIQPPC